MFVWRNILWVNIAFFARIYAAEVKRSILRVNMIIFRPTDYLLISFRISLHLLAYVC